MNAIASVAVALAEGIPARNLKNTPNRVVKNAKTLASEMQKFGWRIISGGTNTHLFLMDTISRGISGKIARKNIGKKRYNRK